MPPTPRTLVLLIGLMATAVLRPAPALASPEHEPDLTEPAVEQPSVGLSGAAAIAESSGCRIPRFYPPLAESVGSLPDSFPIRGPMGALFGRTIGQVKSQLVYWDVPMSDGERLLVHRRLLPALQLVEENLAEAAASGNRYTIRKAYTSSYSARTARTHRGLSYHAVGAAIDINADRNPYRADNKLVTDMPAWFVAAFADAGFCWGGAWVDVKDAMHFSWMGPAATPGYGPVPTPYPPLTAPRPFDGSPIRRSQVYGPPNPAEWYWIADGSGDGSADIWHLRPRDGGSILEVSRGRASFSECSVWRWWIEDPPDSTAIVGDLYGSGRPDLVFVDESDGSVSLVVYRVASDFSVRERIETGAQPGSIYRLADVNRDGRADLWVISRESDSTSIEVWDAASGYRTSLRSGSSSVVATGAATADHDVDGVSDLYLFDSNSVTVLSGDDLATILLETRAPTDPGAVAVAAADYDGDGRPDLYQLTDDGTLSIWLGNQPLTSVQPSSWFETSDFECPPDTPPYHYSGTFADDDGSIFEADIEWLAAQRITRGCNPPFNDLYCPRNAVTRAQMAAFLRRALALPEATRDWFSDDDGSTFEDDINRLAEAGITRGCAADRFCPDNPITRAEMAAFLRRAFSLPSGPHPFTDTTGSIFDGDVGAIYRAGITRGCNPPDNTLFCPDDFVTRAQMAAFLHRSPLR